MDENILQFIKIIMFFFSFWLILYASTYPIRNKYKKMTIENVGDFYGNFKLRDLVLPVGISKNSFIKMRVRRKIEFLALKDLEIARIMFKDDLDVINKMCSGYVSQLSVDLKSELVMRLNYYIKEQKDQLYTGVTLLLFLCVFIFTFIFK